eukprot:TRINITY_DN5704_c0_g1_i1.p1 TRINITY_DN5704_c0_g1~~TRINITY_DN5704_c0_g1_i1.p1  ORF type:complete len:586 (+),score=169.19 TRINITY_DN5704_c0_g1_i1:23-1759(+)
MSDLQAKAVEYKNLGNAQLQQQNYEGAIEQYTLGIECDPTNHILFSNRSAAYHNLGKYQEALEDANKVIEINPQFWKGYSRKGLALLSLDQPYEAMEAYQEGLKVAPGEQSLLAGANSAQQQVQAQQQNSQQMIINMMMAAFNGDALAKARSFPECAAFATSPEFIKKVEAIKANPQSIMGYLQDEQISTFISASMQRTPNDMGVSEEDLAKRQMAEREERLRREEEERLRRKAAEKRRKEEEERRKEEERLASMSTEQINAEAIKNEANELFKKKQYDQAIEKYREAHELDPKNMTFLSNIGAVYFARQQYEECIQICNEALEIGFANRADLGLKARALTRIANCYFKMDDFEQAIEYYNKSLLEQSDRKVSQLLRKAEKGLEEQKKNAYINPELSEESRLEGNEFFKQGKYPEAVKCYTEAIKRNPSNPIPYSNRATAYNKLGAYREAIKDCDVALEIDPTNVKVYLKKAHAYFVMEDYAQCLQIYDQALVHDPENAEVQQAIQNTIYRINTSARDEETVKKNIQNNPELQEILRDPTMQQVLQDLQTDRSAAARHLSNPDIKRKIDMLVAAGVIQ